VSLMKQERAGGTLLWKALRFARIWGMAGSNLKRKGRWGKPTIFSCFGKKGKDKLLLGKGPRERVFHLKEKMTL